MPEFIKEFIERTTIKLRWRLVLFTVLLGIAILTTLATIDCRWMAICLSILYTIGYMVIFCILVKANRLPKAKNMRKAILIVIDADTPKLTKDVQNKLGKQFDECINIETNHEYELLYVSADRIRNHDLSKKESVIALLQKVNCAFLIRIRYVADDDNNAENYKMRIDLGKLHPSLQADAQKTLQMDMSVLASRVKKAGFCRNQLLDTMEFAAQDLSYTCPYCIGLVEILTNRSQQAWDIFSVLLNRIKLESDSERRRVFEPYIRKWAFHSCMSYASSLLAPYDIENSMNNIEQADELFDVANTIYSGTYSYYLQKAYCLVILKYDIIRAEECINQCKAMNKGNEWLVDDAFISAYKGESENTIVGKYERVFANYNGFNLNNVIGYIEYIVAQKPDKVGLHLALTMLYDQFGDSVLASDHFAQYAKHNATASHNSKLKKYMRYIRAK